MLTVSERISTSVLDHQRHAAQQIAEDWRAAGKADATAAIEQLGGPAVHKSIVLDLAYEEYCLLREAGHQVSPDDFVRRFPAIALSLRRQICIHDALSARGVLGDPEDLPEWPVAGDIIGGFLLKEELGRGSFGRVFLASEISLRERQVVVKIARHGLHEAQLLAQVPHAGVVPVYSVATDEEWGLTTLCMPFISRATLLDVIEILHASGSAPTGAWQIAAAARSVSCQDDFLVPRAYEGSTSAQGTFADAVTMFGYLLAGALTATHGKGIFHRDIKPSNILVDHFGCPLLIDFNLSSEPLTDVSLGGTLPYMAPEQLQAYIDAIEGRPVCHTVSESADLFSLGVCLFQLLYGVHPFAPLPMDLPNVELANYLLERQALGPRRVPVGEARVDGILKKILNRCLEFDSRRRPQSASELALEFQKSMSLRNRISRFARINPWLTRLSFSVIGVSLMAGVVWHACQPSDNERITQLADTALRNGQYSDAILHLNQLIEQAPKDYSLLSRRGDAYVKTAQTQVALGDFIKADTMQPSVDLKAKIAWCYMETGHYSNAVRWYREILQVTPDDAVIHNNLGYALMQDSSYSLAIEHFSKAIELDATKSIVYLNRADALFQRSLRSRQPTPDSALQDIHRFATTWRSRGGDGYLLACRICSTTQVPEKEKFLEYLTHCVQHEVSRRTLESDDLLSELLTMPEAVVVLARAKVDTENAITLRTIPPWFD